LRSCNDENMSIRIRNNLRMQIIETVHFMMYYHILKLLNDCYPDLYKDVCFYFHTTCIRSIKPELLRNIIIKL